MSVFNKAGLNEDLIAARKSSEALDVFFDTINRHIASGNPGATTLRKEMKSAEKLLYGGIGDLVDAWAGPNGLRRKYEDLMLLSRGLVGGVSRIPNVTDNPLRGTTANDLRFTDNSLPALEVQ